MPSTSRIAVIPALMAPRRPVTGWARRTSVPELLLPTLDSEMTGESTTATIAPPIGPTMSRKRIACQAITVSPTRISASEVRSRWRAKASVGTIPNTTNPSSSQPKMLPRSAGNHSITYRFSAVIPTVSNG
jgi:hypothetical protein